MASVRFFDLVQHGKRRPARIICAAWKTKPEGGVISSAMLATVTSRLNSRIRKSGMSSREMFISRDQYTNTALHIADRKLIADQHASRLENHRHDYASKSRFRRPLSPDTVRVGDLVYLAQDRDKTRPRDRYMVTSISNGRCSVHKFTGSQLRSKTYQIRLNECYRIPCEVPDLSNNRPDIANSDSSDEDCVPDEIRSPLSGQPVTTGATNRQPAAHTSRGGNPESFSAHTPHLPSRPHRSVRPPRRFQDYVLY